MHDEEIRGAETLREELAGKAAGQDREQPDSREDHHSSEWHHPESVYTGARLVSDRPKVV